MKIELDIETSDKIAIQVLKEDYLMVLGNVRAFEAKAPYQTIKNHDLEDYYNDKKLIRALKRVLAYQMVYSEYLEFIDDAKDQTKIQKPQTGIIYNMLNKYELKQQLQGSVATVVFTKVDGTERTMRCTLLAEYLPTTGGAQLLTESTRQDNPDVLSVWDIDNGGWRSFRMDSIKSITG